MPQEPNTKNVLRSRTVWVNLLALCVGVTLILSQSKLLTNYPQAAELLIICHATLNLVLRIVTDTRIEFDLPRKKGP